MSEDEPFPEEEDDPPEAGDDGGSVEKKRKEIEQRERGLDARADELDERADELEERETELREKRKHLDEREERIGTREEELDERENRIGTREEELDARGDELDEKEETLREYVGAGVYDSVEEAVSDAMEGYGESSRLGTIGSLVLGIVGVMLIVAGVLNGFADSIPAFPVFEGEPTDTVNLVTTILLIFSGLAANLAAVAD